MVQVALILRGKYFFALPGRLYAASPRIPTKEKSPVQQIL